MTEMDEGFERDPKGFADLARDLASGMPDVPAEIDALSLSIYGEMVSEGPVPIQLSEWIAEHLKAHPHDQKIFLDGYVSSVKSDWEAWQPHMKHTPDEAARRARTELVRLMALREVARIGVEKIDGGDSLDHSIVEVLAFKSADQSDTARLRSFAGTLLNFLHHYVEQEGGEEWGSLPDIPTIMRYLEVPDFLAEFMRMPEDEDLS